jgi:hypothetical protein
MAIKMNSTYSKRLGLPGYSSHQFSVSVETELVTTDDVAGESERLYQLLQANVDKQILTTGFVPPYDYGIETPADLNGANHAAKRAANNGSNTAGNHGNGASWPRSPAWKCTDKQREFILNLVEEHQLDKGGVEALAVERFGKGVRLLNKIEASGLIDELLDTHGGNDPEQGGTRRRNGTAYNGANGRRTA